MTIGHRRTGWRARGKRIQRTSLPEPGCAGGTVLHLLSFPSVPLLTRTSRLHGPAPLEKRGEEKGWEKGEDDLCP